MSQKDNVIKHGSENPFESMKKRFDVAAKIIGLDESDYNVLIAPQKAVMVNIPVTMDDGKVVRFRKVSALCIMQT
jgi:glutamate dehydrogenase/leucine dehydrogenase